MRWSAIVPKTPGGRPGFRKQHVTISDRVYDGRTSWKSAMSDADRVLHSAAVVNGAPAPRSAVITRATWPAPSSHSSCRLSPCTQSRLALSHFSRDSQAPRLPNFRNRALVLWSS